MPKNKPFLVTVETEVRDPQTFYVLEASALRADKKAQTHVAKLHEAEGLTPPREISVRLVVELSGPPVRIYSEDGIQVSPEPLP